MARTKTKIPLVGPSPNDVEETGQRKEKGGKTKSKKEEEAQDVSRTQTRQEKRRKQRTTESKEIEEAQDVSTDLSLNTTATTERESTSVESPLVGAVGSVLSSAEKSPVLGSPGGSAKRSRGGRELFREAEQPEEPGLLGTVSLASPAQNKRGKGPWGSIEQAMKHAEHAAQAFRAISSEEYLDEGGAMPLHVREAPLWEEGDAPRLFDGQVALLQNGKGKVPACKTFPAAPSVQEGNFDHLAEVLALRKWEKAAQRKRLRLRATQAAALAALAVDED